MSKHPDWEDNFDDFIRRSVEEAPISFDPEAWKAMEQKLEAAAGQEGSGKNAKGNRRMGGRIAGVIAAILLLSGLGWWILSGKELPAGGNPQQRSEAAGQEQALTEKTTPERRRRDIGPGTAFPPAEKNSPSSSVTAKNLAEDGGQSVEQKANARKQRGSHASGPEDEEVLVLQHSRGKPTAYSDRQPVSKESDFRNSGAVVERGQEVEAILPIEKKAWASLFLAEPVMGPIAYQQEEQEGKEAASLEQSHSAGRRTPLSISLSLAPDFSGTGRGGSTKIGPGFGLHLEYALSRRLSVVSGAFYSKKNYLVDNSFSPYGDSWGYKPAPDYIDVSCGVVDIPLNLRFYALNGTRHGVFLSGGLSSYLMWSEDYTMVYTSGYYQDYTFSVRNENRHLFAVYNLSAGYERKFGGRWALQLEPFMKIPARGVGIGAIKLNSMGAFVHLKYKIGR